MFALFYNMSYVSIKKNNSIPKKWFLKIRKLVAMIYVAKRNMKNIKINFSAKSG